MTLTADFSGAFKKTRTLLNLPKAHKSQATLWSTETLLELKRSGAAQQRSGKGRHTGHMGRNVGQQISSGDDKWSVLLGTGVGGRQTVKYARIQDQGGQTKAHMIFARPGGVLAFPWKGKDTFLRHVHHPGSKIPASLWFTGVIEKRTPILSSMMQPAVVLKVAEMMATSSAGKLARHTN
jgi:hypothetical protein